MGEFWSQAGSQATQGAIGAAMGLVVGGLQDKRQLKQQGRLNEQSMEMNAKMLEMQKQKELEMWEKTGPQGQMKQLEKAGLNAGLMYGMGGAGGQSMGGSGAGGTGAHAPGGSGMEIMQGMQMAMQLKLLDAQKKNIDADTAGKLAEAKLKGSQEEGVGQENAIRAALMNSTPEGTGLDGEGEASPASRSLAFQKEAQGYRKDKADTTFKLDENERQKLMNSKVMEEIGQRISLMAAQGKKEAEIYRNLQKEGKLLDAEIEWNALDIEGGNVGKFLSNVIRMALKPR